MLAIGRHLSRLDLDVIGFQEAYREQDRAILQRELSTAGMVYTHYFRSGLLGSGLFVATRFPIENVSFLRFRLNGHPQDLRRLDYYGRKGIGRLRLRTPYGPLDVYNTHFIAPYLEIGRDEYFAHRAAQAFEAGSFISAMTCDTPVVVTGDLNSTEDRVAYRTCLWVADLKDSYRVVNPSTPGITVTTDIPYIQVHEPERMDYIMYRGSRELGLRAVASSVALKAVDAEFDGTILAYSDHYAVLSVFSVARSPTPGQSKPVSALVSDRLRQVLRAGLQKAQSERIGYAQRAGISLVAALVLACPAAAAPAALPLFIRTLSTIGAASCAVVALWHLLLAFGVSAKEIAALRTIQSDLESRLLADRASRC
jgi:sphingomyelin phosphodiesterase 2